MITAVHPLNNTPALAAYLLGPVDFESAVALQQRLVFESSGDATGQVTLLVCEHPPLITIGRQGSRGDVQIPAEELDRMRIGVRWISRGGGTIVHLPGQVAIYPIVPIEQHGWNVGEYLDRLHTGLQNALADCGVQTTLKPDRAGLWGRTGLVATVACAVRTGVAYFGAYINVAPQMPLVRRIQTDPISHQPMSALAVERRQPVRVTAVRESVVRHLAATLADGRYHIHSRHPLLVRNTIAVHPEISARVG